MSNPSSSIDSTSSKVTEENPLVQEEELEEFFEVFSCFKIREDERDVIEINDFPHFMRALGQCSTEAEMIQMLREVGALATGRVTFDQIVQIMKRHFQSPHTVEELRRAFGVFDCNGDGVLGTREIMSVVNNLGEVYDEEDIREMFAEVDKDRDGRIRADDFIALMGVPEMRNNSSTDRFNQKKD